jgi:hypothetical protein
LNLAASLRQGLDSKHSLGQALNIGMALLGLAAVAGAILTLTGRTGGDQEAFMYAASRLLAGARPGLDLWEVKPPVHLYLVALGQWLFGGPSFFSTLAIDMVLQIAGAAVLAAGLARRFGRRIGTLVALLYLADYYVVISYWTRAQVEATANALMMAALGLLIANGFRPWFLAGVLFATAGITKGLTLLFLVPFGVLVLFSDRGSRSRRLLGFSAGVCAGVLAWAALWAFNGSLLGVLSDLRDVTVFQNSGNVDISRTLTSSLGYVLTSVMWPTLLGACLLPFVDWHTALRRSRRPIVLSGLFLACWVMVSIGVVGYQGLYFTYHYLHFVLGGVLFAGLAAILATRHPSRITGRRFSLAVGLLALLVGTSVAVPDFRGDFKRSALLSDTAHQVYWLGQVATGKLSREEYIQRLALRCAYDEDELVRTAATVRDYSDSGDSVLYLDTGKIAWRANRESASRYFIPLPVQRVLSGHSPQSAGTQAYRDLYSTIWDYDGPVIVLEEGWFLLENDPALSERVFSRYEVAGHYPSPTSFGGHDVLVTRSLEGEHSDDP